MFKKSTAGKSDPYSPGQGRGLVAYGHRFDDPSFDRHPRDVRLERIGLASRHGNW